MPVDYSKWDKLELSDDEDVDVHPNVDRRSFIRWKQEAIHRDRRDRKDKIAAMEMERSLNAELLRELEALSAKLGAGADKSAIASDVEDLSEKFHELQEKQKTDIFRMRFTDRDERWGPPVPDEFVEKRIVYKDAFAQAKDDPSKVAAVIASLKARQSALDAEVKKEIKERDKKITSENWGQVGFDKTIVNEASLAPPSSSAAKPVSEKKIKAVSTIEVLNEPKPAGASSSKAPQEPEAEEMEVDGDEEDDGRLKDPGVAKFAAAGSLEDSFAVIQKYPYIVSSKHADEILAAAFSAKLKNKPVDVKKMVFQSTILSYCLTLSQGGKDGVALFFKRVAGDPGGPAYQGFAADAQSMYDRISARVAVLQENEEKEKQEAIRKAKERLDSARQPDGTYRWPLPEKPTPVDLRRAEIFAEFPPNFQMGLLIEDVDAINNHLSTLSREEGEALLEKIGDAGFLRIVEEGDEEEDVE
ncbi:Cdc37 N terminal kinase binding-domain-containing protein [Hyaloraphidium curvatum]|nr:Cdc37 N terminal kinase binding-domain-containing protein [Hyaloraphidium curvatum]